MKISIDEYKKFIKHSLPAMQIQSVIQIFTHKKDRYAMIKRLGDDEFLITQSGFKHEEYVANFKKSIKILEKIQKVEFPRSNALYIIKEQ